MKVVKTLTTWARSASGTFRKVVKSSTRWNARQVKDVEKPTAVKIASKPMFIMLGHEGETVQDLENRRTSEISTPICS
jgi:hypothetical protein